MVTFERLSFFSYYIKNGDGSSGVSLFWFGLDKCQVPVKTALSLPLLNWTGERKYDECLMDRDKDGGDHSPVTIMGKTD